MITNTPVTFTIPTEGEVEVLGTRDGGGGITYAVYYEMNHTTYFNGMDENGSNLYTLIREQVAALLQVRLDKIKPIFYI